MENRKRTHEVHLRLDDKEYDALERNRKMCKLSQQAYLRKLCKNVLPQEAPRADFLQCYMELRRISNNLNQIAGTANGDKVIYMEEYRRNSDDLWKAIHELFKTFVFPEIRDTDYLQELIERHKA